MKNTRIARLKQSKRVKKATKLLTVGLLICPLAIGTIKALADEAETTPPVEQVAETPATTEEVTPVEETEIIEPVQPEVVEETQPATEAPVLEELLPVKENVQEAGTQAVAPFSNPDVVTEYRTKLANYQQQASDLVTAGATASQMENINLMLSEMDTMIGYYESDFGQVPAQWLVEIDNSLIPALEAEIQKVKDELNQAETVNYTIKCVDEVTGNSVSGVSDITKSANKGDSITETAPEIEGFFVLESTTQTKIIGDNTVFAFVYRRLTPTNQFYDVIGDTTAKVGETKTYKYNKVEYWSNGTSIETIVNVEDTSLPLTSSDPSDIIVNGTITFGSEGTRTLSASNAGMSLEVTVTKDDVTPPTTIDIELNVIGVTSAKVGESKTYQLEKIEYFSDGTKKTTILDFPNEYGALISSDSSDVIKDGTITFGKAGTRTLKSESYGEASFVVTVTDDVIPPVTNVDDSKLTEAIKNGQDKITEGGWESDKALEEALNKGEEILKDPNRTQDQIDQATKDINDAINALVKEDNSNGGNTGDNGSNGTGNSSNDPNTSNNGASSTNNQTNSNNQNSTTTTTKPTGNNTNKDGLPQTGEQSTANAVIAGLSLTMLSILAWFKRKKV
ncbi:LPXTG cell wall anchor domain-containing protein [Candidatus Enterococcus clewellii]|uniref:Gram-positive cocci surface proteins LPxTG domain-containing protein n=1 Tax=Candidatus Enterococcus clewellii TaxID=1834193 RepID=A0A242K2R6_9ENTE|nr:LPXTG cell wall anchor domain-containing protein [Enterococcus sp. 9E7_DIV0242]OTP12796.1 hypothetical protein A5888_003375 [Enterococcus sp. 9E7_DIV0242]